MPTAKFGVVPARGVCWSALVCKSLKKKYNAAGELQSVHPLFHEDAEIEARAYFSETEWKCQLKHGGVQVGPLRVFKPCGQKNTYVEFCAARGQNLTIAPERLEECKQYVELLKRQRRLPENAKIGPYSISEKGLHR